MAPTTSTCPGVRVSSGSRESSHSVISTGMTLMAKIHRHEVAWTSAPPPSGPMTVATPVYAVHVPIAAGRSSASNVSMISASVLGTSSAPAIPWIARPAISQPLLGATAHSSENTPNATTPIANTRRRPNRSPSEPPTSSSDESVSRYASTTHCCTARPPCRLARIDGSATLTIVASRNTIPDPTMLAMSAIRFVSIASA